MCLLGLTPTPSFIMRNAKGTGVNYYTVVDSSNFWSWVITNCLDAIERLGLEDQSP
jgi:hypothetical protein